MYNIPLPGQLCDMFHLFQTGLPKVLTFAGVAQQMGWAMPADLLYMKKNTGPICV